MKIIYFTLIKLSICLTTVVYGQTNHEEILPPAENPKEVKKPAPFISVESMPEFPGGEAALFKYIADNIVYPPVAKKMGITGFVYVYFQIDEYGNVVNAEVKRGIKNGEELNAEALRVIKSMPQWKPGMQNGKSSQCAIYNACKV
jgi:protein TonB